MRFCPSVLSPLLGSQTSILNCSCRSLKTESQGSILLALRHECPARIVGTPLRRRLRAGQLWPREPAGREHYRRAVQLHMSRHCRVERGIWRIAALEHPGVTPALGACGSQPGAFLQHEGEVAPAQDRPHWGEKPRMGPVRVAEVASGLRRTARGAESGVA